MTQTSDQRVAAILPILKYLYPDARCTLNFDNPYQLVVATILAAQCTDERVNAVTKGLFQKYPSSRELANADGLELEALVKPTGFYRNKAKNLKSMAISLVAHHNGAVPQTMDELTSLPGVGRKTANVVLGSCFGKADGVVVDTHVGRLSARLMLSTYKDPVKIERDLMAIVPKCDWVIFSHLLIFHGRAVCRALRPRCKGCPILNNCPQGQEMIRNE